jgi:methyl-accepting chemotaxis protein
MFSIKLRIGAKIAIVSGAGILLVAGMLLNEQFNNRTVEDLTHLTVVHDGVAASALASDNALRRIQLANREIRSALTSETLQRARGDLQQASSDGEAILGKLEREAVFAENRERFGSLNRLFQDYAAAIRAIGDRQQTLIDNLHKSEEALSTWSKLYASLVESHAFAGLAFRQEVERDVREANSTFKDARIEAWRVMATNEAVQIERINKIDQETADALKRARNLADDASVGTSLDQLVKQVTVFADAQQATIAALAAQTKIQAERVDATGQQVQELLNQAQAFANGHATEAVTTLNAALARAGSIGLVVGVFAILVLIGSMVFGVFSIARPISRIGEVLMVLAKGNKSVSIPFETRYDEVGDNARAAKAFRDNLQRIEQMETEQKSTQAQAVSERKASMHKLADEFQAVVGNIIDSVSKSSGQLEKAAGTLTKTAEETQGLSAKVASASEEASANVKSVSVASERMTATVNEIADQVQQANRIAGDAVTQAQRTDVRITELSKAAARIGDVLKLITAIAEQTNLLALNATIEAARAGEAGKGFAVVAQEVKALAAQTAKATDEIGTQIADMQNATEDSVTAIKEIGETINRVSEIASTIAAAVEQQGSANSEILRNVQHAARGTAVVATNIVDVNRGASNTGSASEQVLASAKSLATESAHLKEEVGRFLSTVRAA